MYLDHLEEPRNFLDPDNLEEQRKLYIWTTRRIRKNGDIWATSREYDYGGCGNQGSIRHMVYGVGFTVGNGRNWRGWRMRGVFV